MKKSGGKREGSGRKKLTDLGLEEKVQFTGKVEKSIAESCIKKHGTYANAIRYAAKAKTKK